MVSSPDRTLLFALLAIGVVGLLAPAGTLATFSDSHTSDGAMNASTNFNGGGNDKTAPSSQNKVYNDVNNNGEYDEQTDQTIKVRDLDSYNDPTANVVLSENIGELEMENAPVSITAGNITARVNVSSTTDDVTLAAVDGTVRGTGRTIGAQNGQVTVDAGEGVLLDSARVDSGSTISVSGRSISASNAVMNSSGTLSLSATTNGGGQLDVSGGTFDASTGAVEMTATSIDATEGWISAAKDNVILAATHDGGGSLTATGATIGTGTSDITIESVGNVILDTGSLTATNGAITADLGDSSATLAVDATDIVDQDDTLVYDPDDIAVTGTPNGSTSP